MQSAKSTHLRIRTDNNVNIDVGNFIKSLEREYKIDFRSLPQWKELIQRLHVVSTDCKRRIQIADLRKSMIIDKLYMQWSRPSPFELTEKFARTADKWARIEKECKRQISQNNKQYKIPKEELQNVSELNATRHPNTEDVTAESLSQKSKALEQIASTFYDNEKITKVDAEIQVLQTNLTSLPSYVCTNQHKYISPFGSSYNALDSQVPRPNMELNLQSDEEESFLKLNQTSLVICNPPKLSITNYSLNQQTIKFSITNCSGETLYIKFKRALDQLSFKSTKIVPAIPKRLYPGIPVVFRFIFVLKDLESFTTALYFRVGHDVYDNLPMEALFIPINTRYETLRSVTVSKTVTIPPVYPWGLKRDGKYSMGPIKISVDDDYCYDLRICKRSMNFFTESETLLSMKASELDTHSYVERTEDHDVNHSELLLSPSLKDESQNEPTTADMVALILIDAVELALDEFLLDRSYLRLKPHTKYKIPVYFTKYAYIGYHQCYYDIELSDPDTEAVIMKRSVKVFSEVLPNPIQIEPMLLDMTKSPVCHGYYKDRFVITNNHKYLPVKIKIKLTTKMKKIFYVNPMTAVVPYQSSVMFEVKFCSRDSVAIQTSNWFVHFTFKIIIVGYKTVYKDVPPIFYEMIAPCAVEFKKVYSKKYFSEHSDSSSLQQ